MGQTITNVSGATTTYEWTVPNSIGYNLSLRVADYNDTSVNDTSDNLFAIKGSIRVDAPNGDESWLKGEIKKINWTPVGSYPGSVLIQYRNSTSGDWLGNYTAAVGAHNVTQSYNWSVPNDITANATVKVSTQVGNASIDVNDTSNTTFKIKGQVTVSQPNTNVTWYVGETNRVIKWDAIGTVTPVKIEVSVNNGSSWNPVNASVTGVEGTNEYNWTPIPDYKNFTSCYIRVSDARSEFTGEVTDDSNVAFSILPQINVTQPVANQNVSAHSSNTGIRWTYTGGKINDVDTYYSTDGGSNWTVFNTTDRANETTYFRYTPYSIADNVNVMPVVLLS